MGKLWELVEAHMDSQPYRPSQAAVARKLGMKSPTTLTNWKKGRLTEMPSREHLWSVVDLTGASIHRVLEAALTDAGYYERGEGRADSPAANRQAEGSSATDDVEVATSADEVVVDGEPSQERAPAPRRSG